VAADARELVDARQASDDPPVADLDVSPHGHAVREHDMISDETVVGDVYVGHHERVRPDRSQAARGRPPVQRREFAHDRAGADLQEVAFPRVLQILRVRAQDGPLGDAHILGHARIPFDEHVRADPHPFADLHVGADHGVRAHRGAGGDACRRIDDGRRVAPRSVAGRGHRSMTCPRIVASAATLPSTRAIPFSLPRLARP